MPVATDTRLKIAVFIDFDNIEIGVKTTLGNQFDVGAVLEAIKERGDIISKIAYGDWKRAGDHSRALGQHAVRLVQRNLTPGGDKNGADINLALDALEMALTHTHINAYVIVGGDSDFITLVEKLKQYDKQVLIVGGRQFTSVILQKNCHEFIAYENLVAPQRRGREVRERAPQAVVAAPTAATLDQVFPLVERALGILSEREVSPQLGLLKSTLLQLDSTFSERDYGASTFRDFVDKLSQAGLVTLNQSGRSVFVELRVRPADEAVTEQPASAEPPPPAAVDEEEPAAPPASAVAPVEPVEPSGDADDAVRIVRAAFERAAAPRWPMYIRNVKQVVKAYDPGFDERRYGLGGLIDLLRACQREGLLRLERDRKGVLRVFQGQAFGRVAGEGAVPEEPTGAMETTDVLVGLPVVDEEPAPDRGQPVEVEAVGVAADAELLPLPGETPFETVAPEPSEVTAEDGAGQGRESAAAEPSGGPAPKRRRAATTKRVAKAPRSRRAAASPSPVRSRGKKAGGQG